MREEAIAKRLKALLNLKIWLSVRLSIFFFKINVDIRVNLFMYILINFINFKINNYINSDTWDNSNLIDSHCLERREISNRKRE